MDQPSCSSPLQYFYQKNFPVSSASDEIISAYAQLAMKSNPLMHSKRWNRFLVCWACDEIVSALAQQKITRKKQIKMQVFTINKRNFEKSWRILSNTTKENIFKKKFFFIPLFDIFDSGLWKPWSSNHCLLFLTVYNLRYHNLPPPRML
jgi:hypothetical protein